MIGLEMEGEKLGLWRNLTSPMPCRGPQYPVVFWLIKSQLRKQKRSNLFVFKIAIIIVSVQFHIVGYIFKVLVSLWYQYH